jgi:hypothetical protein
MFPEAVIVLLMLRGTANAGHTSNREEILLARGVGNSGFTVMYYD